MKKIFIAACLAVSTTGAMAAQLWFVDDGTDTLKWVNTDTLAVTTVGALGTGGNFGDMAYDPTTNTMFYIGGRDNNSLYTLNLANGAASLVGSHGVNDLFTLGCTTGGQLYAQSTSGAFYSMNKANGAVTNLGSNNVYPGGYTYDSANGRMVFLEAGGGRVFSVNLANGAATELANPGSNNDNDIAYDAAGNQYFAMDWSNNLFRYDAAFNRTTLGTGFGPVASVEIVNVIPEPATFAVLGVALASLARRRRKA